MILLKDLLADYIVQDGNIFEKIIMQKRLDSQFRGAIKNSVDPGIIWIRDCLNAISKNWGALDVVNLGADLNSVNLDTNYWENLYEFTKSTVPFNKIKNLFSPELNIDISKKITSADIIKSIQAVEKSDNFKQIIADSEYILLQEKDVEKVLETSTAYSLQYLPESRDCDDFSRIFRGWLSTIGLGNLSIGTVWYKGFDKEDKLILYHSVILIIYETMEGVIRTIYAEPQKSNKTWVADGSPSGMFWSRGVRRIEADLFYF